MFKVEKDNKKIGKYLSDLISQRYASKRQFCKAYISASGVEPNEENTRNMSNRLSQIIKGAKAIQTYDLPYFTDLLGVSCEQILSAGEYCVPISKRVTNYSIACSKNPQEWEAYINREDKLILNSDEYCKTIIDYALEFNNYELLKYLMDKGYIWFDSRKNKDYFQTFGAGTSIERRPFEIDYALEGRLKTEDKLRMDLIALAVDNNDLKMLDKLRAREIPQLYRCHIRNILGVQPGFNQYYNERMVKHIAASSEHMLDYFTEPFEIRDPIRHTKGIKHVHTFMFPFISQLLDELVIIKSHFTETAFRKALKRNKAIHKKLCELIISVKNDEQYTGMYTKNLWIEVCRHNFEFIENGNIILFNAFFSTLNTNKQVDGIITNIAHVTKIPTSPILKHLAEELNDSYNKIRNLNDHLEEITK